MYEKIINFFFNYPVLLKPWFCSSLITMIDTFVNSLCENKIIAIIIIFIVNTFIYLCRDKIEKFLYEEKSILKIRFVDNNDNDMNKLKFNKENHHTRNNIKLNIYFNGKKNKLPTYINISCENGIILDFTTNYNYVLYDDNKLIINLDKLSPSIDNQNKIFFEENLNLELKLDSESIQDRTFKRDIIVEVLDHEQKEFKNTWVSIDKMTCTLEVS